jgi:hypothetical protein
MLLALGAASIFAWSLRTKTSDRLLLYFGIWCGLYGLRLLALQTSVRAAFGGPARAWIFTSVFVTYIINVPPMASLKPKTSWANSRTTTAFESG